MRNTPIIRPMSSQQRKLRDKLDSVNNTCFDAILYMNDPDFKAKFLAEINAQPGDEIQIISVPHARIDGRVPIIVPKRKEYFDMLKHQDEETLKSLGIGIWDRDEKGIHWLYPVEWYDYIPEGYPVFDLCYETETFVHGHTDNDGRYGFLPYGFYQPASLLPIRLHLPINHLWYDMVVSGNKKEEYRDIKGHWISRLYRFEKRLTEEEKMQFISNLVSPYHGNHIDEIFQNYKARVKGINQIVFHAGYGRMTRKATMECLDISIREGNPDWGAEDGKLYFVFSLGKVLSVINQNNEELIGMSPENTDFLNGALDKVHAVKIGNSHE